MKFSRGNSGVTQATVFCKMPRAAQKVCDAADKVWTTGFTPAGVE